MSNTLTTLVDRVSNEQLLTNGRESVRKLWLCGLGAYSLATRTSTQAFGALVREGKAFSPKARRQIEEKSAELKSSATATIARGEELVKERVVRPLDFLALATRRDVEQLSMRVVQLASEVHSLVRVSSKAKPMVEPPAKSASESPTAEIAPTADKTF